MAASASSRLLRFSNNVNLQNLIRQHLLRPTVGSSQLLSKIPEPRFSDRKSSGYVAEILERKTNGYGYSLSVMGSSVVDHHSGILSIQSGSDELYYDSSDDWTTPDEISGRHDREVDGIRRKNEKVEDYDDPDDEEDSDYDEEDDDEDDSCDDEDEIDE